MIHHYYLLLIYILLSFVRKRYMDCLTVVWMLWWRCGEWLLPESIVTRRRVYQIVTSYLCCYNLQWSVKLAVKCLMLSLCWWWDLCVRTWGEGAWIRWHSILTIGQKKCVDNHCFIFTYIEEGYVINHLFLLFKLIFQCY